MPSSSAFTEPDGNSQCLTSEPPRFHAATFGIVKVPYLYQSHEQNRDILEHEPGCHTDDHGRFCPKAPVPLLAKRYRFVKLLGEGISAVLVQAEDTFQKSPNQMVAVKILHTAYYEIGYQEVDNLQKLNREDPYDTSHIVKLLNIFTFDGHFCIVFELLQYKLLTQVFTRWKDDNKRLGMVRKVAVQMLHAIGLLRQVNIIHTDIKPENILALTELKKDSITTKMIDFGNAIRFSDSEMSIFHDDFDLTTLMYRAPEVMFGTPYGIEIDMWSLGCTLAELFLGELLFIGDTRKDVVQEMYSLLGPIPHKLAGKGKFYTELKSFVDTEPSSPNTVFQRLMRRLWPHDHSGDAHFVTFLLGLLQYDPAVRMTPWEACQHPFISPEFNIGFLMPIQSAPDKHKVVEQEYIYKRCPFISDDVKRHGLPSVELLRRGTHCSVIKPSTVSTMMSQYYDNRDTSRRNTGQSETLKVSPAVTINRTQHSDCISAKQPKCDDEIPYEQSESHNVKQSNQPDHHHHHHHHRSVDQNRFVQNQLTTTASSPWKSECHDAEPPRSSVMTCPPTNSEIKVLKNGTLLRPSATYVNKTHLSKPHRLQVGNYTREGLPRTVHNGDNSTDASRDFHQSEVRSSVRSHYQDVQNSPVRNNPMRDGQCNEWNTSKESSAAWRSVQQPGIKEEVSSERSAHCGQECRTHNCDATTPKKSRSGQVIARETRQVGIHVPQQKNDYVNSVKGQQRALPDSHQSAKDVESPKSKHGRRGTREAENSSRTSTYHLHMENQEHNKMATITDCSESSIDSSYMPQNAQGLSETQHTTTAPRQSVDVKGRNIRLIHGMEERVHTKQTMKATSKHRHPPTPKRTDSKRQKTKLEERTVNSDESHHHVIEHDFRSGRNQGRNRDNASGSKSRVKNKTARQSVKTTADEVMYGCNVEDDILTRCAPDVNANARTQTAKRPHKPGRLVTSHKGKPEKLCTATDSEDGVSDDSSGGSVSSGPSQRKRNLGGMKQVQDPPDEGYHQSWGGDRAPATNSSKSAQADNEVKSSKGEVLSHSRGKMKRKREDIVKSESNSANTHGPKRNKKTRQVRKVKGTPASVGSRSLEDDVLTRPSPIYRANAGTSKAKIQGKARTLVKSNTRRHPVGNHDKAVTSDRDDKDWTPSRSTARNSKTDDADQLMYMCSDSDTGEEYSAGIHYEEDSEDSDEVLLL